MVPHVGFEGGTVVLINFNGSHVDFEGGTMALVNFSGSPCWLRGRDCGSD